MIRPLKLLLVAGPRPNFMKIAPVIHPIRANHAPNRPIAGLAAKSTAAAIP